MTSDKPSDSGPEGIPAATIIIFRNAPDGSAPEVLMTVRSRNMTFAGGMAVFPGGRVDEADRALAGTLALWAAMRALWFASLRRYATLAFGLLLEFLVFRHLYERDHLSQVLAAFVGQVLAEPRLRRQHLAERHGGGVAGREHQRLHQVAAAAASFASASALHGVRYDSMCSIARSR